MKTIKTPFSNSKHETHYLFNVPSTNKCRSAYILLYDKLRAEDDSMDWAKELKKWLLFRKNYLRNEKHKNNGKLICSYCGRDDLISGFHTFNKRNVKNLATIDHIIPLSKNGLKYDKNNCCVSCKKCNHKKSDMIIDDFVNI
jgi:5-methylcytosine-specific restriction endonuclease McrA